MPAKPFDWKPAFLAALRQLPVLNHACTVVGIDRTTAWRTRDADADFNKEVLNALEDGIDRAEQEAFRRGVVGFEEPVIDRGRLTYQYERYEDADGMEAYRPVIGANGQPVPLTVRKYSDTLLALVLKGRRRYTDRAEISGPDGAPLQIDETARSARVAQLLALAAQRKDFEDLA